jgi:hypothetical protein
VPYADGPPYDAPNGNPANLTIPGLDPNNTSYLQPNGNNTAFDGVGIGDDSPSGIVPAAPTGSLTGGTDEWGDPLGP